jgi:hypothetical protein
VKTAFQKIRNIPYLPVIGSNQVSSSAVKGRNKEDGHDYNEDITDLMKDGVNKQNVQNTNEVKPNGERYLEF